LKESPLSGVCVPKGKVAEACSISLIVRGKGKREGERGFVLPEQGPRGGGNLQLTPRRKRRRKSLFKRRVAGLREGRGKAPTRS